MAKAGGAGCSAESDGGVIAWDYFTTRASVSVLMFVVIVNKKRENYIIRINADLILRAPAIKVKKLTN